MLLWSDHPHLITEELTFNSDPAHVDACSWSFDEDKGTFTATFISEDFATVTMTKLMPPSAAGVLEADLAFLAGYASAEIERNLNEMGCMSMFNLGTDTTPEPLPEGVECRFVVQEIAVEEATEEAADFWANVPA